MVQLSGVEARIANSKIEQVFKAEFVPIEISYHEINSYQNKSTQYIVRITDTINYISLVTDCSTCNISITFFLNHCTYIKSTSTKNLNFISLEISCSLSVICFLSPLWNYDIFISEQILFTDRAKPLPSNYNHRPILTPKTTTWSTPTPACNWLEWLKSIPLRLEWTSWMAGMWINM